MSGASPATGMPGTGMPATGVPTTGVVVTGGASGIGLASADALAQAGRAVAIWDLDGARAAEAAAAIGARYGVAAAGFAVDVRDPAAIEAAARASLAALPSVGGFVHSAGTSAGGGIDGFDPDAFDAAMRVHVRPIPLIARALREAMRREAGSAIVAVASMQAGLGDGRLPTYTAAKGAIRSLVLSMAEALAADGIRVNSVSPGMVRTPMLERAMPPGALREASLGRIMLGRLGEAAEIGRAVRFLMSDEASYVTGADLLVDGGYTASTRRPAPGATGGR